MDKTRLLYARHDVDDEVIFALVGGRVILTKLTLHTPERFALWLALI